jgi:hypothetical protein
MLATKDCFVVELVFHKVGHTRSNLDYREMPNQPLQLIHLSDSPDQVSRKVQSLVSMYTWKKVHESSSSRLVHEKNEIAFEKFMCLIMNFSTTWITQEDLHIHDIHQI